MVLKTIVCLIACSILVLSQDDFLDNVKKCPVKDEDCLKASLKDTFVRVGSKGVQKLSIPSFDPLVLDHETISILDAMVLEIINGKVTGIKDCTVNGYKIDLDNGKVKYKFSCDKLTLIGDYKLRAISPLFKDTFGSQAMHGEGKGKTEMKQFVLTVDIPVQVEKRDGETYLKYDYDHAHFEHEIQKSIKFSADNLYIGDQESSQTIVAFANANWKALMDAFGKPVMEKGMKITFNIISKFYDCVPTKYYIVDDLSSYVKP